MDYKKFADQIIKMKNVDLAFRDKLIQGGKLSDGYNIEMEQIHNDNSKELNEIINKIGYPTIDKVGNEANEAAWLIIQHSISRPTFMKKCADLLSKKVTEEKSDRKQLAYLTDRIAVYEGKAQLYGTQFDWDENGELSPHQIDDLVKVNQRRKSIGLNTLEEQTVLIRRQAQYERQTPPTDFTKRKNIIDEWRKKTGWVQ